MTSIANLLLWISVRLIQTGLACGRLAVRVANENRAGITRLMQGYPRSWAVAVDSMRV
jgi:hypothetical protein